MKIGALGMKVSEEYGGLGLSQVYYSRALALAGVWHSALCTVLSAHQSIGVPQPNNEGTYLIVNKTLIEAAAVCVLLVFNTGAIAGLDLLWTRKKNQRSTDTSGVAAGPAVLGAK